MKNSKINFSKKNIAAFFLSTIVLFISCSKSDHSDSDSDDTGYVSTDTLSGLTYVNPVYNANFSDPTVMKDSDGFFYAYTGGGLCPILKSKDLVSWTSVGNAFTSMPTWKTTGGDFWAPDVKYVDGKYFMYYAISLWGDENPAIGVATASSPTGPFTDHGKLFDSKEINVYNSIDPVLWVENGKKYLVWGSLSTSLYQGIYGIQLSDDGLSYIPDSKFHIGAGDIEGSMLYKRNGYYYFIGSKGTCCDGVTSTYHLIVARSKNFKGPYLDKNGKDIAERGYGTVILDSSTGFVGPGHCAEIMTDDAGNDWLIYHAIPLNAASYSGNWYRSLMLDRVSWKDNWPSIGNNGKVTTIRQKGPVWN